MLEILVQYMHVSTYIVPNHIYKTKHAERHSNYYFLWIVYHEFTSLHISQGLKDQILYTLLSSILKMEIDE